MDSTSQPVGAAGNQRTWGDVLQDLTVQLADAGVDSSAHDATELLLAATGMSQTDLFLARREPATDEAALSRAEELASRRAAREPLQHILGSAPMMGLELAVGKGVFVPRPETELLAEWGINRLQEWQSVGVAVPKVVDLCTGSGALALSLADACPSASIAAVEIDDRALSWAAKNLTALQEKWNPLRQVELRQGDATTADSLLAPWLGQVHVLVSNPPYVPLSTSVSPEVKADPHHAVFGGEDGLDVIRPMIDAISNLLIDGGWVGIEHDDDSGADVAGLFAASGKFESIETYQDFAGRDRFTVAQRTARGSG